ncbi:MAG: hypothetical protein ACLQB4_18090 [Beijerinckiaceae bacterium]
MKKSDCNEPFKRAQRRSVGDLKIMMQGAKRLSGALCAVLRFGSRQSDQFADAISNDGGKANATRLQNTERALPAIKRKAMAA